MDDDTDTRWASAARERPVEDYERINLNDHMANFVVWAVLGCIMVVTWIAAIVAIFWWFG